jgi:glycine C-acetyltransferase
MLDMPHALADVEETLTALTALKSKLDVGFYCKEELVSVTKGERMI